MSVVIKEVTSKKELKKFVKFNIELYKGNPYHVPGLIEEEMVHRNQQAGRLHFTTDLTECLNEVEVLFSAVGTPPDEDGSADLKYVLEVARTVGRNMTKHLLVVTIAIFMIL